MNWTVPLDSISLQLFDGLPRQYTQTPATLLFDINTAIGADATAGAMSAVERLTISWGRKTPRDSADAGEFDAVFLYSEPDAVPLDSWLLGYVLLTGGLEEYPVLGGIIQSVTYQRAGNLWRYRVHGVDAVGYAAQAHIGSAPWPEHTSVQARLQAIQDAQPVGIIDPDMLASGNSFWPDLSYDGLALRARDVDNTAVLDLIERATIGAMRWIEPGAATLTFVRAPGMWISWHPNAILAGHLEGSLGITITDGRHPPVTGRGEAGITLDSGQIEDSQRGITRRNYLSGGRINYWIPDPDKAGATKETALILTRDTVGTWSAHTIDTDLIQRGSVRPYPYSWLQDVIYHASMTTPAISDKVRLRLGSIDLDTIRHLTELGHRGLLLVWIDDTPDDLQSLHAIVDATLTVENGAMGLAVTMLPARLGGYVPLRFMDIPSDVAFDRLPLTLDSDTPGSRRDITFDDIKFVGPSTL